MKIRVSAFVALAAVALASGAPRASDPAWKSIGPDGGCLRDLAVNPANPGDLAAVFLSTPAQVFRTANGGRSWRRIGLFDDAVLSVAFGPAGSGRMYAMSQSALFVSRNGGSSWTSVTAPPGFGSFDRLAAHPKDPDGLVIAGRMSGTTASIGVATTTDGGATWKARRVSAEADQAEAYGLCVCAANPDCIYISGCTWSPMNFRCVVFRTTNGGAVWADVTGDLSTQVYELAADPTDPSKVYAAAETNIYRTSDGGRTWLSAESHAYGYGLAIDPADPSTIYAGAQKTVFKSEDGGVRWTPIEGDFSGRCSRMAVAGASVFFGSDAGLFRSADAGLSWAPAQAGIAACRVPSFFVSSSDPNVLYANVSGRGFYSSSDFGRTWTLLPYFYQCDGAGRMAAVDPGDPRIVYMLAPGEG